MPPITNTKPNNAYTGDNAEDFTYNLGVMKDIEVTPNKPATWNIDLNKENGYLKNDHELWVDDVNDWALRNPDNIWKDEYYKER